MKKLLMLLVLGSASMVIADDYNPYSGFQQYRGCESGACQNQNRGSWSQGNQGNQGQGQGWNQNDHRNQNRNQSYYSQDDRNQGGQGGFRQNDRNDDQRNLGGMRQDGMQNDRNAMYSQDQNNQGGSRQNDRNFNQDSRNQGLNNNRNDINGNMNSDRMNNNDRNVNGSAAYSQDRTNSNAMSKTGTDQDLHNRVRDALSSGWFSKGFQDVTFDVNNGIVTLRGFVGSIDDKNKAEDDVKKLDGVRSVNNQIAISKNSTSPNTSTSSAYTEDQLRSNEKKFPQDVAESNQDRQLNARIRDKISNGWFTTGYETVVLRTNNGVVTISGTVDSNDDAQKITDRLKDIDGVRSVNNQLNVKTR